MGKYLEGGSPYGALDMAGNVWEWVSDWYSATYYASSPPSNPLGPENQGLLEDALRSRVLRGGAFIGSVDDVRSANRSGFLMPDQVSDNLGFRCAMSATP